MLRLQTLLCFGFALTESFARPNTGLSSDLAQNVLNAPEAGPPFELDSLRLVQLSADAQDTKWMSERAKLALRASGTMLIDITDDHLFPGARASKPAFTGFEYPTPNSTYVDDLLPNLSKKNMEDNLSRLTSFYTRYYNSETGRQASQFLYQTLSEYAESSEMDNTEGGRRVVTVMPFHHSFKQYSIIVRIAATKANLEDAITIVGAHIDSLNYADFYGRAPGADDDGSGTVTILEACRVLLQSGYVPQTPVEFHFYAGEEGGLLGSHHIASYYANRTDPAVSVKGMLQLDMTAWIANGTGKGHVGITTSHSAIGRPLADFNRRLVERYLNIPWIDEPDYPWGSSDSFSWDHMGYPASDTLEATWKEMRTNHTIHGPDDHQFHPEFSFDHMLEYAKLAVAFAVELGGRA